MNLTDNLVDATEIGERLGIDPRTIHQWRRRHAEFPEPAKMFAIGPVWWWSDIAGWLFQTGRLDADRG